MAEGMTETAAVPAAAPKASPHHHQQVLWVKHYTERLFSFGITRPDSFRFRSGEFVMLGLPGGERPVLRAYSIASPWFAEELEFFSIKVPDGPLTSRLQAIEPGDTVLLGRKPTGTLVLDALKPGRRLFMISTGTGLAPFLSVARDPDAYERFETMIVTHTVREPKELAYETLFEHEIRDDPLVGEAAAKQLTYYSTVTRSEHARTGRITDKIRSGEFFRDLGLPGAFDPAVDRVMVCGSMAMIRDVAALLEEAGLNEGSNHEPGEYVIERAFVG